MSVLHDLDIQSSTTKVMILMAIEEKWASNPTTLTEDLTKSKRPSGIW